MVQPKSGVARPSVAEIAPEREHRLVRMQLTERVGPSHFDKPGVRGAGRGLQQRVFDERFDRVDIEVRGHHVVVACQDDGDFLIE